MSVHILRNQKALTTAAKLMADGFDIDTATGQVMVEQAELVRERDLADRIEAFANDCWTPPPAA